ncbi:glycosyltransferase [Turicibacter bilis]|uniref:glycosyltransferase n=1 Tax=Turicibacter bilis TaxID=2735723 RepID=UPI0031B9B9A1
MKKVLHVTNNLHNGGIEKFILSINEEVKEKVLFDYAIITSIDHFNKYVIAINQYGGSIYDEFPRKYLNKKLKNIYLFLYMRKLLSKNYYQAIHIHECMGVFSILLAAYWCQVPVRIVHSHTAYPKSMGFQSLSFKSKFVMIIDYIICYLFATNLFGCSIDACNRLFGNRVGKDSRIKVIYNGIDLNVFCQKNNSSVDEKKEVIQFCNIGRYTESKNQLFLLDIFANLNEKLPCHLNLVGFGELESDIVKKIKSLSLEECVTLLPHDSVIPDVLGQTDYFILPSLSEGLGIVLIEAQAMGIRCFISDAIPQEAQLGLCEVISLDLDAKEWGNRILDSIESKKTLKLDNEKLMNYDIKEVSHNLLQEYLILK